MQYATGFSDTSASQLPPNIPSIYDVSSSLDHLRFFSGGDNPFTPPLEEDDNATEKGPVDFKLYYELKQLLPDDFRRARYRRKLFGMRSMNHLTNVRYRINKGVSPSSSQHQQQRGMIDDNDNGNTSSLPSALSSFDAYIDDPDFTLADARAHIGRLIRMKNMESEECTDMKKQIYELEVDHADQVLRWKQKLKAETRENKELQSTRPSTSLRDAHQDNFSCVGSVDTNRFLDALDPRKD